MKKIVSIVLSICLLLAFGVNSFAASNTVVQTVKALGIMSGSSDLGMNLEGNVTRAELSKMLVKASSYRNDCSDYAGSFSIFTDVDKDHWANQYIYTTVKNGWLLSYSDNSFKPNQNVLIEELCAAVVRLLGYQAQDLTGSYPDSYINKAKSIGILNRVTVNIGQYATREECANIFYNALCAKGADGKTYGEKIGCTVNNGQIDYSKSFDTNADGIYYGVIKSNTKQADSNTSAMERRLTVICADGITRSFDCSNYTYYDAGTLVSVNINGGNASVSRLYTKLGSGKINSTATKWGTRTLADNLQVLDTDLYGNAVSVDVSRLANTTLHLSDVRYYAQDTAGNISVIILNDVTGDLWKYGYCLSSDLGITTQDIALDEETTITILKGAPSYYEYYEEGMPTGNTIELNTDSLEYLVIKGGVAFKHDEQNNLVTMRQLIATQISAINSKTAQTLGGTYDIAEDALAYVKQGDSFYEVNISSIDTSKYQVFGYYDALFSKEIKLIVCFDLLSLVEL